MKFLLFYPWCLSMIFWHIAVLGPFQGILLECVPWYFEDLFLMLRVNPYTIISHGKCPFFFAFLCLYNNSFKKIVDGDSRPVRQGDSSQPKRNQTGESNRCTLFLLKWKNCSGYRVSFNTYLPAFTALIAALRGKKIPHTGLPLFYGCTFLYVKRMQERSPTPPLRAVGQGWKTLWTCMTIPHESPSLSETDVVAEWLRARSPTRWTT